MRSAIETKKLTRVFDGHTAVDRLDLEVPAGRFFGFLGPNGAGKSTTIRLLTGMLKATSGSAAVLGHDIAREPEKAKASIGVVPEELAIFDRLTAPEYLVFVGRMYGMERETIFSRSEELLELMDLQGNRRKLIVDFSHGMKKKLALAAALIHDPQLLFLDEPFEGIDAISSRLIKDLLQKMTSRGVSIFLTSHILEIVEKLCSDLAIIDRGKLIAHGTMEELRRGVQFSDVEEDKTLSLEEAFLSLVEGGREPAGKLSWLE